jgi:hypothetical protein
VAIIQFQFQLTVLGTVKSAEKGNTSFGEYIFDMIDNFDQCSGLLRNAVVEIRSVGNSRESFVLELYQWLLRCGRMVVTFLYDSLLIESDVAFPALLWEYWRFSRNKFDEKLI